MTKLLHILFAFIGICVLPLPKGDYEITVYPGKDDAFVKDSCFWEAYKLYQSLGWNDIPISPYQQVVILAEYNRQDSITVVKMEATVSSRHTANSRPVAYFYDIENKILSASHQHPKR